jgi:chemotaxis signal transduction protein
MLGLHNLRGEILASVDLSAVLGIAGGSEPRHLVVVADGARRAGLAVDELFDLAALPNAGATTDSPFLRGGALVEGTLVGVVDVPAVLESVAGTPAAEIS